MPGTNPACAKKRNWACGVVVLTLMMGCRRAEPATTATTNIDPIRTSVVDSIFPVNEEIRRFKQRRGGTIARQLNGGSATRDALVARFVQAVEAKDTTELRAMALDAAEFVDLYYPSSVFAHRPYRQSPELTWLFMQQTSEKAMRRVLDRWGGMPPRFEKYSCQSEPRVAAANRYWEGCFVQWSPSPEAPRRLRVFGTIIEKDGRFKVVSYANDL